MEKKMLLINNKEFEITSEELKINEFINNGINGYCINLELKFKINDKIGYLNLSAGFQRNANICEFINKEYIGKPFDKKGNQINNFEVFDTNNFYDTEIESDITFKLKTALDDKIDVEFEVKDKLLEIKFNDCLNR